MVSPTPAHGPILGAALSPTELVVVGRDDGQLRRRSLPAPFDPQTPAWQEALAQAMRELVRDALRTAPDAAAHGPSAMLRIALLSPLSEVRPVPLPPVSDDDAVRILSRTAARHFLDVSGALAFAVTSPRDGTDTVGVHERLACAMSLPLLQRLREAAAAAGCSVQCIVPAISAWCHAVPAGARTVAVALPDHVSVITMAHAAPVAIRRFRATGDEDDIVLALAETGGAAGRAGRVHDAAEAAARALAAVQDVRSLAMPLPASPEPTARRSPMLAGRRTTMLFGAGLLACSVAALLGEWSAQRALVNATAERARIAPQLATAGAQQRLQAQARVLLASDSLPRPWSRVLVMISDALPDDAYLDALRVRGDTVELAGNAADAGRVFSALAGIDDLEGLSSAAPLRRESTLDGEATDRFRFVARRRHR